MMLIDILILLSIRNGNIRLELPRLSTASTKQHQEEATFKGTTKKREEHGSIEKKDIGFYTILHTFSDHHSSVNFQH